MTRNIQCEFQVPITTGPVTIIEPPAQYMYPRVPGFTEANGGYYTPLDFHDVAPIADLALGTTWYTTNVSQIYEQKLLIGYRARYSVTNMSNSPVRYQKLVFRCIRMAPNVVGTTGNQSMLNPLNPAGTYNATLVDGTLIDAANAGLHTERNQIKYNPAFNHWYRQTAQKSFVLSPGQSRNDYVTGKRRLFNMIDMYPSAIINNAATPQPSFIRWPGTKFIMYKMFSMPADLDDAKVALDALTTRTIPVSLLCYQVNYSVHKPAVAPRTQFNKLESLGFGIPVGPADIVFMGDAQVQQQNEVDVQ